MGDDKHKNNIFKNRPSCQVCSLRPSLTFFISFHPVPILAGFLLLLSVGVAIVPTLLRPFNIFEGELFWPLLFIIGLFPRSFSRVLMQRAVRCFLFFINNFSRKRILMMMPKKDWLHLFTYFGNLLFSFCWYKQYSQPL